MIPTLAERSLEGRRRRRIPDETIADMQRAGFFRVLQPRRWGGYEMDLNTFYEVELALAEGDMSTAWIYGVSGVHPWFMALLDDRAAQEVWGGDSATLICSSLMPAGKATVAASEHTVSAAAGNTPVAATIATGPCSAPWSPPTAAVRPRGASFCCRASNMRASIPGRSPACRPPAAGTSSSTMCWCRPIARRACSTISCCKGPGQALNTSSLYRLPFGQIFVRGISTAALGALQGMLDALLAYGKTRVTRAGGRASENPFVQLLCAETAAAIDEMKTTLHRNFRNLHAYARRGETPPLDERLQYKFQSTAVTERCTLLAARIFKATGAAGLAEELPFGGILADLMAGRQHISNQYEYVGSSWGGVMFGLENKDLMV